MSLVIVVPTRGRPDSVTDLVSTFVDTRQVGDTRIVLAVDATDTDLKRYRTAVTKTRRKDAVNVLSVTGGTMVAALNEAALTVISNPEVEAVGFFGDDHRPRTFGWDASYLTALRELGAGIVYGNDLLQYGFVPTQCAMSADIVRELGWMAHPSLRHMYVDTLWRDMGDAAGRLRYLPDVIVEHMHPLNGKSEEDEGYIRVNAKEVYAADEKTFNGLHANGVVSNAGNVIARIATDRLSGV
jgi:hypothetical protein